MQPVSISPVLETVTTTSGAPTTTTTTVPPTTTTTVPPTTTTTTGPPAAATVKVKYNTVDGTAIAKPTGDDYNKKSGTLSFPAGTTSKSFDVIVRGDTVPESTEDFTVVLNTPTGASIADGTGLGTITDTDPVTLSIADASLVEGDSGTTKMVFTVSVDRVSDFTIKAKIATTDGDATQIGTAKDYNNKGGSVTVKPGQSSAVIEVVIKGDVNVEPDETINVTLSAPQGAVFGDSAAVGTILNDDGAPT
ncbi:MAG: Calx-beta domain-containing protein [Actinomycetota bacterium]|nr:Calx-beta domain-containing protein [Actinomycetota bacterium]